jgi:hypothetical protein
MDVADRLFRVVVLGGIALVAAPGAAVVGGGCGGSVTSSAEAGTDGGFPQETASFVDTGAGTEASAEASTDGSVDAGDACFPHETAVSLDAACGR